MATPDLPAPPSTSVAVVAALASQLLGTAAFFLVVAWAWSIEGDARIAIGVGLALGTLWVFAGGSALRGSLAGLFCCALLDLALAATVLANASGARAFVHAATARVVPQIAAHVDTIFLVAGGAAVLAAVACVAAIPQVRRMAVWQDEQIARLA